MEATRTLVRSMFVPTSDPPLVERMVAAMSAAPPHIGIGWLEALWGQDRNLQAGLQEITARKIAINSCYCPTNRAAAQQYGIEVMLMGGVRHFVMLEDAPTLTPCSPKRYNTVCLRAPRRRHGNPVYEPQHTACTIMSHLVNIGGLIRSRAEGRDEERPSALSKRGKRIPPHAYGWTMLRYSVTFWNRLHHCF